MTDPQTAGDAGAVPGATIAVDNPATGEVIGRVADTSAEQVAAAVERALRAQPGWARLGADVRSRLFARARHWMLTHRQEIVASIVAENGKAEEDAVIEVVYCVGAFAHWARHAPRLLADTRVRSLSPLVLGRRMYTQA
ncbi:aldehyde dehydrogenase family protein [Streptomyces sp. NPDC001617]